MRILMLHNEYAKPSGEEHAVQSIAALLRRRGHEVLWFLRSSAELVGSPLAQARAFFSGIYSTRARRQLDRFLDAEPVDLVQAQNLFPLLSPSALVACRERGLPVVMRCPNYRLLCPNGLQLSRGEACDRCLAPGKEWWCILRNCAGSFPKSIGYAARHAAARITGGIRKSVGVFIVLSEFQKQRFVDAGIPPEKIEVLPNFVPAVGEAAQAPCGTGETISFVGRISPEKGLEHFLDAARAMPAEPFAVAGDASQAGELVRRAPANVAFHGFLTGGGLEAFFRRTRVLAFPSVCYEGFPNVLTRAMVWGKPVVCSRIGGLPEIVDDGVTGLLFEPGNAGDLAAKLRRLCRSPELCRSLGEAGRRKALTAYSQERYYERLVAIYRKAAAVAPGPTHAARPNRARPVEYGSASPTQETRA